MLDWLYNLPFLKKISYRQGSSSPHPANVPGQFYVEDGCCMTCGVPNDIAPDLFDWVEGENHCFVKKQPSKPAEFDRMFEAMNGMEAYCIRAKFADPEFYARLAKNDLADQVDE